MRLTSSVHAYLNGELHYAKGQQAGTRYLIMFISTADDRYWSLFESEFAVPVGDSLARAALARADEAGAHRAFLLGRNHPDDIADLIWLFKHFGSVSLMAEAVLLWKKADAHIGELLRLGRAVRSRILNHELSQQEIQDLLERVEGLSAIISMKEDRFSEVLRRGSRRITTAVFYTNVLFMFIIVGFVGYYSAFVIQRLTNANEKFRRILDFGGLSSSVINYKTRELFLGPELLAILDMNRSVRKKISFQNFVKQFVLPKDQQRLYQVFDTIGRWEQPPYEQEFEFDVKTVKGNVKILRWKLLVREADAISIIQDITSLRKFENDSLLRSRYIENILYSITDGLFGVDQHFIFTMVNPSFEKIVGRKREELIGRHLGEVLPQLVQSSAFRYHEDHLSEKIQLEYKSDNGRFFDVNIYPYEHGRLIYIRDITEKKRIVHALEKREQNLKQILSGLPVAVYLTDVSGVITSFNEAAIRLWKRIPASNEKWCGAYRLFTNDGQPLPLEESPFAISVRNQAPLNNFEALLERTDGERISFIAYATPFHTTTGDFAGAVNVMIDISRLKNMEKLLKEREKEQELKRITHLIEGQETERARLSRELHDGLGQLLNAIQFNLESISHDNFEPMKEKVVRLIGETLVESKRMSSDLLPFTLIHFDLVTCVKGLCEQISGSKIKVTFQTQGHVADLSEQQKLPLYRIIQEGLQNAVKHSGGSRIFVQLYSDENNIHVSIEDDGRGFDKDTTIMSGHGLRNIRYRVDILKGKLEIESNPRFGTLLSVSVPYKIAV